MCLAEPRHSPVVLTAVHVRPAEPLEAEGDLLVVAELAPHVEAPLGRRSGAIDVSLVTGKVARTPQGPGHHWACHISLPGERHGEGLASFDKVTLTDPEPRQVASQREMVIGAVLFSPRDGSTEVVSLKHELRDCIGLVIDPAPVLRR